MLKPSLDVLMDKVDSKYTMVTLVAKRARQIVDGDEPVVECDSSKPVTAALYELDEDKLKNERTVKGIK